MSRRARKHLAKPLVVTLIAFALAGCISTSAGSDGRYATPLGDAPVISNETPYSWALQCLGAHSRGRPVPRIAVGQIADYTAKFEADGGGRKITQGAALMAISALAKAGVSLVERYDTSVAELELKYANNKLIGDAGPEDGYRKIFAGSIAGSDFYLVGGITELNYNIRSTGNSAFWSGRQADTAANADAKTYVMNVGLDLRLVDTRTLQIVDVISYQKQIVGRQLQAGVFTILGQHVIDIGVGESALEPVQLAVRAVIERAVLEIMSRLYRMGPEACRGGADPLADSNTPPPLAQQRAAANEAAAPTEPLQEEDNHEASRSDPYRGYGANMRSADPGLRLGLE
jgi:curli production assembly/transport component CsgG/holdfast attachment protein HfaB